MTKTYETEASIIITELMDELMLSSPLDPALTGMFRNLLIETLTKAIIIAEVEYKPVIETLYGFENDKSYTLAAFSSEKYEYLHVLFPSEAFIPFNVTRTIITYFREQVEGVTGEQIKDIAEKTNTLYGLVKQVLNNSTRSKRFSTHKVVQSFVLPSPVELERFYKCGRKHAYTTEVEAVEQVADGEHVYHCNYCNMFHKGHPMTGQKIPKEIMMKRWETAYRRLNKV